MKNYLLLVVFSIIFALGITNTYAQDNTKNVEKRELAKEAKNDATQEINTQAAKMKKKSIKNAKIDIAKADKITNKKIVKK
jgi:hypothetical protein